MRKTFKRAISMLIVVVMILAMLPTFASAAETYPTTPITSIPAVGTPFVIYAPSGTATMGAEATGGKTPGYAAVTNEETADIEVREGTGVYKLAASGTADVYYLTCGGKYYTATSTSAATFNDAPAAKGSK